MMEGHCPTMFFPLQDIVYFGGKGTYLDFATLWETELISAIFLIYSIDTLASFIDWPPEFLTALNSSLYV